MWLIGLAVTIIFQAIGVAKWLDAKQEARWRKNDDQLASLRKDMANATGEMKRDHVATNERINLVKDTYAKLDAHDKDMALIRAELTQTRKEIKGEMKASLEMFQSAIRDLQKDFTGLLTDLATKMGRD